MRREDVDHTVDGLRRILGVQGGEDEVAGLGSGQCHRDRLEVAELADEDHIRVLAQDVLERGTEAVRVMTHLALVHDRHLVGVHELDGVFDRHDVVGTRRVDEVDHRREGGRLARTGRTGHEHEATGKFGEVAHAFRDAELFELLDLRRDQTEGGAHRPALLVEVHAEPGIRRDRESEIELEFAFELLALLRSNDAHEGRQHVFAVPGGGIPDRAETAVDADHGRRVHGQVKVGCSLQDDLVQGGHQVGVRLPEGLTLHLGERLGFWQHRGRARGSSARGSRTAAFRRDTCGGKDGRWRCRRFEGLHDRHGHRRT